MPGLRERSDPGYPTRLGNEGADRVPPSPVSGVREESDHLGSTDPGNRHADRDGDGASDPAFPFFRSDWFLNWSHRSGYEGSVGFAKYLKQNGILSGGRQRRISRKEINGIELDGEAIDKTYLTGLAVTDSDLTE